ncbi:MAG: hypothetical protein PHV32_07970, partial [Eubacteriales bacterium]|nr:hypothetical protein [Eubacteriales bacterium]
MQIKHMPRGLFPHIKSGIERQPVHPAAGEIVNIGCRLDGGLPDTKVSLGWKVNGIELPVVQGKHTAQNDQGQS